MTPQHCLTCLALVGALAACAPTRESEREYCAEVSSQAGLDTSSHPRAAAFQAALDEAVAEALPGAALMVQDPSGLWIGSSGQCDVDEDLPFGPFTRSRVGSVTKTYTAAATLLLAEEGLLQLDDVIADHLDTDVAQGVTNSDRITIRQLLNHTSGLPVEPMELGAAEALDVFAEDPYRAVPLDEYVAAVYGEPALFEPGEGWSYSNFGYGILGLILEDATGRSNDEVIRSRVIEPLDLTDTWFDADVRTPPGLARGYADLYGDGTITDTSDWDALHPLHTEGGVVSTVYDQARLMEAVVEGDLLSESSKAEMLTCVDAMPDSLLTRYGLGIACTPVGGKPAYGHTGLVMGYISAVHVYPEQQAVVSLLMNGSHGDLADEAVALFDERLPALLE